MWPYKCIVMLVFELFNWKQKKDSKTLPYSNAVLLDSHQVCNTHLHQDSACAERMRPHHIPVHRLNDRTFLFLSFNFE